MQTVCTYSIYKTTLLINGLYPISIPELSLLYVRVTKIAYYVLDAVPLVQYVVSVRSFSSVDTSVGTGVTSYAFWHWYALRSTFLQ